LDTGRARRVADATYIKEAYSAPPTDGSNGASCKGNEQKNRAQDDVSQPVTEHCQEFRPIDRVPNMAKISESM